MSVANLKGMRRAALAICCLAFLAALPVAGARPPRSARHVEVANYLKPAGVWTSHYDEAARSLPEDTFTFQPKKGERFVDFTFEDVSGRSIVFHIRQGDAPAHQGPTGDHAYSDGVIECGTSYTHFELRGRDPVEVSVYVGLCPDHTFGYATAGTITATFGR